MATKAKSLDEYLQFYTGQVAESIAGDGKVTGLETTITTREKRAIAIYQATFEIHPGYLANLVALDDRIHYGITCLYQGGQAPTYIREPGILFADTICGHTAARVEGILARQFTFTEPILVHPAACYLYVIGESMAGVVGVDFRLGFKYVDLSDQMYQELFQTVFAQNMV